MKGVSLFSGGGVGEAYFEELGIKMVLANELLEKRAKIYSEFYPETKVIPGDICDKDIKEKIIKNIPEDSEFLLATPPCQGISSLGKNKYQKHFEIDRRNFLILEIFEIIDKFDFNYILIENVSKFLDMYFPYDEEYLKLEEILKLKYGHKYVIDAKVLNAKDYGVPQSRPRAIIKMYKKGLSWPWPQKQKEITLREAIGHLPSLEAGEKSEIKWHFARNHTKEHIMWMRHTPEGKSAFENEFHFPRKKDGSRVRGFPATYSRMNWDKPAPTITIRNDAVSSQRNVHPGRKLKNGTYSDARVLTLLELFIVSSLPEDWDVPENYSNTFIRTIIGESVPPLLLKKILEPISKND